MAGGRGGWRSEQVAVGGRAAESNWWVKVGGGGGGSGELSVMVVTVAVGGGRQ